MAIIPIRPIGSNGAASAMRPRPASGERGRAAGCWVLDAGWVLDEASWVLDEAGWVESIDWRGLCTYTLRSPSCVGCAAFPLGLLCEGV